MQEKGVVPMEKKLNDLIGKFINRYEETDNYILFYTDSEKISIDKFIPYCACNVGEYVDSFTVDGEINGAIVDIGENINECDGENGIVYSGDVSFFFEHGKINMNVHGEDSGYYGVSFCMPVTIDKLSHA